MGFGNTLLCMSFKKKSFYEEVRVARRIKGMTQAALAKVVNCKQSAISMYEAGHSDALAYKTITIVAEALGLTVPQEVVAVAESKHIELSSLKYCPIDDCPSNIPYVAGGELHFKPAMIKSLKHENRRCSFCGEILQDCCPNESCGMPITDGGFCSYCGDSYITVTRMMRGSLDEWAAKRCGVIKELRSMSETVRHIA